MRQGGVGGGGGGGNGDGGTGRRGLPTVAELFSFFGKLIVRIAGTINL